MRSYLVTTPGRLALRFVGVCAAVLLAAVVTLLSAADASRTIRTIGSDAEPSVVLALRIGASLADLDAVATEDALAGGMSAAGTSRQWRAGKADLDALLVQASRNITYADETTALQNLLRWTGEYHASLAEVRGAADPAHPFTAIQRLQWSRRLLREFDLPEADALATANRKPLVDAYAAYGRYYWQDGTAAAVAILPLVGVLVAVQLFLVRRTHRLINPTLVAATVLALCLAVGLLVTAGISRESVRSAKIDCFDSLNALFSAKAAVAAINADLSLWLLDPATRQAVSDGIDARARTLMDVQWRDGPTWGRLLQALTAAQNDERQGRPAAARAELPEVGGLLGKELDNITFGAAERDPASDAARGLLDFMQVADRVRALGTPNQMGQAVHIRETGGAAALARLQGALDRTIAVNQMEFDARIGRAQRLAAWTPVVVCAGLVLVGLLTAAGLWPRYREYM
ncbi:MAG: hypothetical protein ACRYHQ_02365 [Janthinobacterium lividum]